MLTIVSMASYVPLLTCNTAIYRSIENELTHRHHVHIIDIWKQDIHFQVSFHFHCGCYSWFDSIFNDIRHPRKIDILDGQESSISNSSYDYMQESCRRLRLEKHKRNETNRNTRRNMNSQCIFIGIHLIVGNLLFIIHRSVHWPLLFV
jgi:hypothetical protein